jgi:hypothetical protein
MPILSDDSPQSLIADLDEALSAAGQTIVLRRLYGQAPNVVNVDSPPIRANVRSPDNEELAAGYAQTDSVIILSPTDLASAQWPGGELPSTSVANPSLPRKNDKAIFDGRVRNVELMKPFVVASTLVRLELRVLG